jgi:hypothetical protein
VKRAPWYAHNDVYNLPAVAAAMLAVLPWPTTQRIILCSLLPKQFQYNLSRACVSRISTKIHQVAYVLMLWSNIASPLPSSTVGILGFSAWGALRTYLQGFCAPHEEDGTGAS